MLPGRDNIAAPDLPAGLTWVGTEPESMPSLTAGGPALVHFLDFAQLNSVRTLPYLREWSRRYREAGLSVIGVQSPRSPSGPSSPTRRRRPCRAGESSSLSRSTPSTTSGAPMAARAGPASSSGASAAPSPGSTSARASTRRRRSRSRKSCARWMRCSRCRSRWRRCAPATLRRLGHRPHPRDLPRRLLGATLDGGRGRRGAGAGVRRPRVPSRPSRERERSLSSWTGSPPRRSPSPAPRSTPWPSTRATRRTAVTLRPAPGMRIWSV